MNDGYLSLRPVDIDTPTALYRRFRFLFIDGHAKLINEQTKLTVVEADGEVETAGNRRWTFTTGDDTWTVIDAGSCACKGSSVVPK